MNTDKALPIDKEVLSKVFYYDPTSTTGLRWKVWNKAHGPVRRNAGDVAGKLYYCSGEKRKHEKHMGRVTYSGKTYPIHRVIWTLEVGEIPDEFIIDHIDGNPFNNTLENLRCIHSFDNPRNAKKRKDNKTGLTGVSIISNGTGRFYVCAYYYDNGVMKTKQWPLTQYSEKDALSLAAAWRTSKLKELEKDGIFYSQRHGL